MAPKDNMCLTAQEEESFLHPKYIRDEDERQKVAFDEFSDEIPVISLTGIEEREEVRRQIVAACEEWGIFQVVDHGVDLSMVEEMSKLGREFFALPAKEKLRFDMSGGKKGGFTVSSHLKVIKLRNFGQRGERTISRLVHKDVTPSTKNSSGEAVEDWREIVTYFSYPVAERDYSRWPDKPREWRAATEAYSQQVMELGLQLLGILSDAMGLPKDALSQACVDMDQKIVVNYYPKCPRPDLTLGLKRHTDPGLITLLLQDQVGGLQATRDGGNKWITVRPVKGAFVVNLGDYAHYVSNGRFKNADHQAVVNSKCSRLSIATFQNPSPEAKVYPLKMREGEKSLMEEPITFAEMYKRKMSSDLELARLKKLASQKNMQDDVENKLNSCKSLQELLV